MSIADSVLTTEKARLVSRVASEAIKSRNLDDAVQKFGQGLSVKEISALKALSQDELKALVSIDAKLAPLGLTSLY